MWIATQTTDDAGSNLLVRSAVVVLFVIGLVMVRKHRSITPALNRYARLPRGWQYPRYVPLSLGVVLMTFAAVTMVVILLQPPT
jgi:hypothetical protein